MSSVVVIWYSIVALPLGINKKYCIFFVMQHSLYTSLLRIVCVPKAELVPKPAVEEPPELVPKPFATKRGHFKIAIGRLKARRRKTQDKCWQIDVPSEDWGGHPGLSFRH